MAIPIREAALIRITQTQNNRRERTRLQRYSKPVHVAKRLTTQSDALISGRLVNGQAIPGSEKDV